MAPSVAQFLAFLQKAGSWLGESTRNPAHLGLWLFAAYLFIFIAEYRRHRANLRFLLLAGARELQKNMSNVLYLLPFIAAPWFYVESISTSPWAFIEDREWLPLLQIIGVTLFALSASLRIWAVMSLGPAWTMGIVDFPGLTLERANGPYKRFHHPEYISRIIDIISISWAFQAPLTGLISASVAMLIIARLCQIEGRLKARDERLKAHRQQIVLEPSA